MRTRVIRQKYRVVLDQHQRAYFPGLFGMSRAIYNKFVYEREALWEAKQLYPEAIIEPMNQTISRLTAFKHQPSEYEWLKDYPAWTVQQVANQAKDAYSKWWDSLSGRSAAKQQKPRYKKKGKNRLSVRVEKPKNDFKIEKLNKNNSRVWLGKKIGWVKFKDSRAELPLNITGATLVQEPTGKTYISFVCSQEIAEPKVSDDIPVSDLKVTTADLGLTDLLAWVNTDGERGKVPAPRHYRRAQRKLKRAQQAYSRKQDGSKNKEKARLRVARLHEQVRNARQDHQRKIAAKLASENQVVGLESLNVVGMVRNRHLAKSVSDAAFGSLVESIKNACERHGTTIVQISQWEPTSRTCSQCGCYRAEPLSLGTRAWQCQDCCEWLDRDYNAALNIMLAAGLAESLNACGGDIRRRLACADPVEARSPALMLVA